MKRILAIGHYSHDVLVHAGREPRRSLGGAVAYVSATLSRLGAGFEVVSKVGEDFAYFDEVAARPMVVPGARTTSFVNDYTGATRSARVDSVCEPLWPRDLGALSTSAPEVAIVCGIAGEVPPETIQALRSRARLLVADIQGFIRIIAEDGRVRHAKLDETPYRGAVGQLDFLKLSREEAGSVDLEALKSRTRIIVTEGASGCTVLWDGKSVHVPAPRVEAVDTTGAGDCFLAGFAAGLLEGLPFERSAELGNHCGAAAVREIGVPRGLWRGECNSTISHENTQFPGKFL